MADQRIMEPFDRFTQSALRVLFFARLAVSQHGGRSIRDTHLVLGLLQAAPDSMSRLVVGEAAVQTLAACLNAQVASPDVVASSVEIPFDERVKQIIDDAHNVANVHGHHHLTPEHLLLAVLRDGGEAAACLRQVGVNGDAIERLLPLSDDSDGLAV